MKRYLGVSIVLLCLLFLLPLATVVTHVVRREAAEEPAAKEETKIELLPPGETDGSYTIRVLKGDKVETMTMGEYLQGVVRAEMPASF